MPAEGIAMAAKTKWTNSISVVGIPLKDLERDTLAAAHARFCSFYEFAHGCTPSRKEFILTALMMAAADILAADDSKWHEALNKLRGEIPD